MAAVFGVISILVAISLNSEPAIVFRSILIVVFLLLTTPVGAHVMAQAAYYKHE
jgi:multicomponent Na+:H+ antiporter subunit G